MKRRHRGRHSVCLVKFEDRRGHLHTAVVRVPRKVAFTHTNLVRLTEQKTGLKVSSIFGEECTNAERAKSHPLPRRHS